MLLTIGQHPLESTFRCIRGAVRCCCFFEGFTGLLGISAAPTTPLVAFVYLLVPVCPIWER